MYGQLNRYEIVSALSGVAMVGILNIFASFALSFILAVRARNIGDKQSHRFLREVGRELLANPLAFILPRG
jgi:site-specific recombinase